MVKYKLACFFFFGAGWLVFRRNYNLICILVFSVWDSWPSEFIPPREVVTQWWWHSDVTEVTNHSAAAWGGAGCLSARCQPPHTRLIRPTPATRSDRALMAQATLLAKTFLYWCGGAAADVTGGACGGTAVMIALFHLAATIPKRWRSTHCYGDGMRRAWCLSHLDVLEIIIKFET